MIISVDTGNKLIKTENCEFNSGISILDKMPGEQEEVIEYAGKYYMPTSKRLSYLEDKTEDERYFILTLFAIARELFYREECKDIPTQEIYEVELLVGLPPAHYGKLRKSFKAYFYRNGEPIKFCYKNRTYTIAFKEVKVYIQAYAAYCLLSAKKQLSALPKVLMIDIGGFTVDYMLLRYGRLEIEHVDSLENGVICLYNNIKASIRQKYSILLEEEDIDNIILERPTNYPKDLKERVREVAIGYVKELLGTFRELGIDFRTTQTVFLGGGSILISAFIPIVWKENGGEYCIINDTKANAKGYRMQYLMRETYTKNTYRDYNKEFPLQSYQETEEQVKEQIDYSILKLDHMHDERIEELVGLIVDVLTSVAEKIRVNKEEKPAEVVKVQFRKLRKEHVEFVLLSMDSNTTKARNIRAVLITALYNAVNTMGSYYGNLVRYHMEEERRGEEP